MKQNELVKVKRTSFNSLTQEFDVDIILMQRKQYEDIVNAPEYAIMLKNKGIVPPATFEMIVEQKEVKEKKASKE